MITIETARNKVLAAASNMVHMREPEIWEEDIVETAFAWYIPFRDTQPDGEILIGSYNGFIVSKEDGNMVRPGSGFPIEKWLTGFELGILQGPYDLEIVSVDDPGVAVWQLSSLGLTCFRPEEEGGVVWKIPYRFTKEMIEERLRSLPCVFRNQRFAFSIDNFVAIREKGAFSYLLFPTSEQRHNVIGEELSSLS